MWDTKRQWQLSEELCGVDRIWNTGIGHGSQRIESDQKVTPRNLGVGLNKEGSPRGSVGVGKWLNADL